jgi:hypothetical protein
MQSRNLRTLVSLCLTFILAGVVAFAGPPAQSELSFSAEMFDPKKGDTVWSATAEWLIPVAGGPLLVGPSVSKFDAGWLDGGAAGIAAEINLGKVCGPGIGGAAHKPIGDSGDQVNLTYEARLFFKCGTEHVREIHRIPVVEPCRGRGRDGSGRHLLRRRDRLAVLTFA